MLSAILHTILVTHVKSIIQLLFCSFLSSNDPVSAKVFMIVSVAFLCELYSEIYAGNFSLFFLALISMWVSHMTFWPKK
jgi:hypothetical protein